MSCEVPRQAAGHEVVPRGEPLVRLPLAAAPDLLSAGVLAPGVLALRDGPGVAHARRPAKQQEV